MGNTGLSNARRIKIHTRIHIPRISLWKHVQYLLFLVPIVSLNASRSPLRNRTRETQGGRLCRATIFFVPPSFRIQWFDKHWYFFGIHSIFSASISGEFSLEHSSRMPTRCYCELDFVGEAVEVPWSFHWNS